MNAPLQLAPARAPDVGGVITQAVIAVCRLEPERLYAAAELENDLGINRARIVEILARLLPSYPHAPADPRMLAACRTWGQFMEQAVALLQPDPGSTTAGQHRDKVVLITGSGRGIGRVLAKMLAAEGANVVVNSFHSRANGEATAAEICAAGGRAIHAWGSVAKPDHVERIFREIDDAFGGLDYFVNNASNGLIGPLNSLQPEHWERCYGTNVVGLHLGAMRAVPRMQARGGGRIVSITSPGAQGCIDHFGCQGSMKAAVESLLRYLAVNYGRYGVRANAVSPGPVAGDLLINKYPDQERLIPHWRSLAPGGRLSSQEDVCRAVMYLLSSQSCALNGSVILADVGTTLRM